MYLNKQNIELNLKNKKEGDKIKERDVERERQTGREREKYC